MREDGVDRSLRNVVGEGRGVGLPPTALAGFAAILGLVGISLSAALGMEHIAGVQPCELCLMQRWAYYFTAAACPLPLLLSQRNGSSLRALAGTIASLVAAAMLANACLGIYHAGVEWHLWAGPQSCSGPGIDLGRADTLLRRLEGARAVRCDEPAFRLFGLSLAGYSAVMSAVIASIAGGTVASLFRREENRRPVPDLGRT